MDLSSFLLSILMLSASTASCDKTVAVISVIVIPSWISSFKKEEVNTSMILVDIPSITLYI